MRSFLRLSTLLVFLPLFTQASEAKISRLWTDYRTTESFERIGEFFGGEEKHPGRLVLRSQEKERSGLYFLVRVDEVKSLGNASLWRVLLLRPGKTEIETFDFPLKGAALQPVFELGLTGGDWPDPKANPTAWKVVLLDASGRELLSQQSFLWR